MIILKPGESAEAEILFIQFQICAGVWYSGQHQLPKPGIDANGQEHQDARLNRQSDNPWNRLNRRLPVYGEPLNVTGDGSLGK